MTTPNPARILLLLFATIATSSSSPAKANVDALATNAERESRQQGATAYYSGATSSTYTATTVDHSAGAGVGAGPAVTSTATGTAATGAAQPQSTPQLQAANFGVPPAFADLGSFEMNSVLRPGEYIPNCGCVARGACQREIGQYTRLVGAYSDVVCGINFERCCFDGPCPGVLDEFVRAAPCVPQEQCLRPYGVLPTDVRDFGIIAPCPGQGAVRCISVDDSQLLQFQAAVAAIEASQERYTAAAAIATTAADEEQQLLLAPPIRPQPQPENIVVPIVGETSQVSNADAQGSVSTFTSTADTGVSAPVVSGQTTTVTTGTPNNRDQLVSNIATFLASNGIGTATGSAVQAVTKGDVGVAPIRNVVAPPASGFVGGGRYGLDCRSSGCYTPWAYRGGFGYPGAGVGYGFGFPGVGFSKSFHYSKGFGVFG